ncbi:MAG: penicillin-binding protein 2 [Candidatus Puniceispirillum sp.]|nr:penicillin-binding protein 2 [Candidatus Pelagibacter sp.]MBA4283302.1 penicillin-binding protein 2 [Candidatus Puniceispirillum sp.]
MFEQENPFFSRRLFIFTLFQGALVSSLIARLYYLQIYKESFYKILSDKNYLQYKLTEPSRGIIVDRNNKVLASHKTNYKVFYDPSITKDKDVVQKINVLLKISPEKKTDIRSKRQNILIKDYLSWEELSILELNSHKLQGMVIEKGESRLYHFPLLTSHIIGYTSSISKEQKKEDEKNDLLWTLPGFKIGKTGLEKVYNDFLQGEAGYKKVAVDAYGKIAHSIAEEKPKKGKTLHLSIDLNVQNAVTEVLKEFRSASVTVLNIHNGEILSMVSQPQFDATIFDSKISSQQWKKIQNDSDNPLINKNIAGLYAPGSIFKLVVAYAALHENLIDENTRFSCSGYHDLGGHRFHCWKWKYGGHGSLDVMQAIAQSCDVYFYHLGLKLGQKKIAEYAKVFGYGELTGIDIPGERKGFVPDREWKKEKLKTEWFKGDTLNMSIGQGYLLATPLQNAHAVSILVNKQRKNIPHFNTKLCEKFIPVHLNKHCLDIVQEGMRCAVQEPLGTAHHYSSEDIPLAGKTASTQVSRISMKDRESGNVNGKGYFLQEHAMFVGYAPIDDPQYSISVLVEHGGGGGRVAAPVAKKVVQILQKYNYV